MLLLAVVTLSVPVALAQVGVGPLGTYDKKGIDTIDLSTLDVSLDIPLLDRPGRSIPLSLHLTYNTPTNVDTVGPGASGPSVDVSANLGSMGWQGAIGNLTGHVEYTTSPDPNDVCDTNRSLANLVSNVVYIDRNGYRHQFPDIQYDEGCRPLNTANAQNTRVGYATDANIYYNVTGSILTYPNGTVVTVPAVNISEPPSAVTFAYGGMYQDPNGNILTVAAAQGVITDTLGHNYSFNGDLCAGIYAIAQCGVPSTANGGGVTPSAVPPSSTVQYVDSKWGDKDGIGQLWTLFRIWHRCCFNFLRDTR